MVSFKHILLTFTILSASIWFTPVTSEFSEMQKACVETIQKYTAYKNTLEDYQNTNYSIYLRGDTEFTSFRTLNTNRLDEIVHVIEGLRDQYMAELNRIKNGNLNKYKYPLNAFCGTKLLNDDCTFIKEVVREAIPT